MLETFQIIRGLHPASILRTTSVNSHSDRNFKINSEPDRHVQRESSRNLRLPDKMGSDKNGVNRHTSVESEITDIFNKMGCLNMQCFWSYWALHLLSSGRIWDLYHLNFMLENAVMILWQFVVDDSTLTITFDFFIFVHGFSDEEKV